MIRWADPERIGAAVDALTTELRGRHPEITPIHWYGSWVSGGATAGSDVDLCVVLASDVRRPRVMPPPVAIVAPGEHHGRGRGEPGPQRTAKEASP